MLTEGNEAIMAWVDGLEEADLDAALRCLRLSCEGSADGKRYRLMRHQLRAQKPAEAVRSGADVFLPSYEPWPAASESPSPATVGHTVSEPSEPGATYQPAAIPSSGVFTMTRLDSATNVTYGDWFGAGALPVSTSSPSVPTTSAPTYTGARSRFIPSGPTAQPTFRSVLRANSFATGTPTHTGTMPPFSEQLSLVANQSLLNTVRDATTCAQTSMPPARPNVSPLIHTIAASVAAQSGAGPTTSMLNFPRVPTYDFPAADQSSVPFSAAYVSQNNRQVPAPPEYAMLSRGTTPPLIHAGEIVRKWRLTFSGKRDHSAEEFLLRVNECRRGTRLTETDLLEAMPVLLSGLALQWFRLERPRWNNWQDFLTAFRRRFGGVNFQLRVREEVRRRTQGPGEAIADYLVGLRHIMSYVVPPYSEEERLDFAYANLHPDYSERIERDQLQSLEDLERKGEQLEAARILRRGYSLPPSPQDSLFPEHACLSAASSARSNLAATMEKDAQAVPSRQPSASDGKKKSRRSRASSLSAAPSAQSSAHASSAAAAAVEFASNAALAPSQADPQKLANAITGQISAPTSLSSAPPNNAESTKREMKCYWCEAPGYTTRSCLNPNCMERRKLRGNGRGRRRQGSTPSPANIDQQ